MLNVSIFGWLPVLGFSKYLLNILRVLKSSLLVQFTGNFQAYMIHFMMGKSFMLSLDI